MTSTQKPLVAMGFDYGTVSTGIAIGQTLTRTAEPLTAVKTHEKNTDLDTIAKLVKEWKPDVFVVGVPTQMNGSDQEMTALARQFAYVLKERFQRPVFEVDERLTTREARAEIFERQGYRGLKKATVDALSAKIILEAWLHTYKPEGEREVANAGG